MVEEVPSEQKKGFDIKNLGMNAWIGIAVAALVIGVLIGKFALGGGAGAALNKASLTENELGTVVATYNVNGTQKTITAKEVMEMTSTLDSFKDEEGNYTVPSSTYILTAAHNTVLVNEAEKRGINPTDEELLDYAESTLGLTPDFESMATSLNLEIDVLKKLLTNSYRVNELQKQVSGELSVTEPQYPAEPEYATTKQVTDEATGETKEESLSDEELQKAQQEAYDKETKEYAEYIIGLAGDEWDAEGNKWKDENGEYAQALSQYKVSNDGASFMAAYAAYQVAYSKYSTAQSENLQTFTDFENELFKNCSITINTML